MSPSSFAPSGSSSGNAPPVGVGTVRRARYWALRNRLSPAWRAKGRATWDALAAWAVGSWRATQAPGSVAVTFDDGPVASETPALLDLLEQFDARCTFFVLLTQARHNEDLLRGLVARGHELALHGVDHRRLTDLNYRMARSHLAAARSELESIAGTAISLYRPPYGSQSLRSWLAVRRSGMHVVVWSADAADWLDRPSSDVAAAALDATHAGGILLLHERLEPDPLRGAPSTSFDRHEMVRLILEGLVARGLNVRPVGELARQHGVRRTAWFRP